MQSYWLFGKLTDDDITTKRVSLCDARDKVRCDHEVSSNSSHAITFTFELMPFVKVLTPLSP